MTTEMIQNSSGQYFVDWGIISRLLHSYWAARLQSENMRTVNFSESKWYNPFSWSMPTLEHLEVDWQRVRHDVGAKMVFDFNRLRNVADTSVRDMANEMLSVLSATRRYKQAFTSQMQILQRRNSESLVTSLDSYEDQIALTKAVRDTAAGTLMVGGTFLTGGAAAAVLGGGTVFKGVCKFQDTDSVGAATMEAVGSLAFTLVKVKIPAESMTMGKEGVLVLVEAGWETATSLVAGETFKKAIVSGSLKLTGPLVGKVFESGPVTGLLGKISIPVNLSNSIGLTDLGVKVVSKSGAEFVQKRIEVFGEKQFGASNDSPEPTPNRSSSIAKEVMLDDEMLLKLAVVNMQNGIGRGW